MSFKVLDESLDGGLGIVLFEDLFEFVLVHERGEELLGDGW